MRFRAHGRRDGHRARGTLVWLLVGREADEIRQRWEAEVDDLYTAHANSHPAAVAEYVTAPPRSLRRVALMIGRARGVKVPWGIASELPRVFTRTWGAWSRLKLEEAARAAAG